MATLASPWLPQSIRFSLAGGVGCASLSREGIALVGDKPLCNRQRGLAVWPRAGCHSESRSFPETAGFRSSSHLPCKEESGRRGPNRIHHENSDLISWLHKLRSIPPEPTCTVLRTPGLVGSKGGPSRSSCRGTCGMTVRKLTHYRP